jgi:predicted phosphoribosyltransferase
MVDRFTDRRDAGRTVARQLLDLAGRPDVVVLALPRGGVPVAAEVAAALHAPLDVFVVRKLGVPANPELAMGAIASGGVRVLNDDVLRACGVSAAALERVTADETRQLEQRERAYRGDRPPLVLHGKVAILVDDGLATGATMAAAVKAARGLGPAQVVVAVPVGSREACRLVSAEADRVVCPLVPPYFESVGRWYDTFQQTSDAEVLAALAAPTGDDPRP